MSFFKYSTSFKFNKYSDDMWVAHINVERERERVEDSRWDLKSAK
jgi:hypothetical protein